MDGAPARQCVRRGGELIPLDPCAHVVLKPGETIVSLSCGGAGYGSPLDRDPALVRHDVQEGWITRERAQQIYGVMLDRANEVDAAATAALRADHAARATRP